MTATTTLEKRHVKTLLRDMVQVQANENDNDAKLTLTPR